MLNNFQENLIIAHEWELCKRESFQFYSISLQRLIQMYIIAEIFHDFLNKILT